MKKDNIKTATIRCDDNAEAVVFSKYTTKDSIDFEFSFEDSYCGRDFNGISGRFRRAWKAFWNKPVCYSGIYCEIVGSNDELGMFIMLGLIVWLGHCAAKYLFN